MTDTSHDRPLIPPGSLFVSSSADIQCVEIAPKPPTITVPGEGGQVLVRIHPDGRVEFGEGYRPEEAAQAFWAAVQRLVPTPMVQQFGAPLTARINAELSRGEAAEGLLRTTLRVCEAVHSERVDGHRLGALQDCTMCDLAGQIRALLSTPAARPH